MFSKRSTYYFFISLTFWAVNGFFFQLAQAANTQDDEFHLAAQLSALENETASMWMFALSKALVFEVTLPKAVIVVGKTAHDSLSNNEVVWREGQDDFYRVFQTEAAIPGVTKIPLEKIQIGVRDDASDALFSKLRDPAFNYQCRASLEVNDAGPRVWSDWVPGSAVGADPHQPYYFALRNMPSISLYPDDEVSLIAEVDCDSSSGGQTTGNHALYFDYAAHYASDADQQKALASAIAHQTIMMRAH